MAEMVERITNFVTRRDNRGESGVYTFEIISGFGERNTGGMWRGIRPGGGRSGSLRAV